MKKLICVLCLLFVQNSLNAQAVTVNTLCSGLQMPVGIHNSGVSNDDRLFILEKRGRIRIVNRNTGALNLVPFLDITSRIPNITSNGDERGLLGLAFHPDYASNGYFYVNYTDLANKTVIARYQVSPFADTAFKYSEQIMLHIHQPYTNHNGGNLMFGPQDDYLYIALGDGGSGGDPGNRAQNIDSLLGKTLRIDVDNPAPPFYFSAPENPFYGPIPGRDEIFDWGLRNHWRCSFDRLTHDMWTADVGQLQWEEINFRERCDTNGHNYGWRCYEGNTAYNATGCQAQSTYVSPVHVYNHSNGCSVTGGYVYRGAKEGNLFGKYIFTDYCQSTIRALSPNGSGAFTSTVLPMVPAVSINGISSFGEDVDGELYMARISNGVIYTLKDTACAPTAFINYVDSSLVCGTQITLNAISGSGLTYSWTVQSAGNWSVNSGQGSSSATFGIDPLNPATIMVTVSNGTCSSLSNGIYLNPGVSFSGLDSVYCTSANAVSLQGSNLGGIFSGPGINGNVFSPYNAGTGTHVINYSYTGETLVCGEITSSCTRSFSQTVKVQECTGLAENSDHDFKVFPNPSKTQITVEFKRQSTGTQISLFNELGQMILTPEKHTVNGQKMQVSLEGIQPGLYFMRIEQEGRSSVRKLIVEAE